MLRCVCVEVECALRCVCVCGSRDMAVLARAAVGGDERALDQFTWGREGKEGRGPKSSLQEGLVFYVSTVDGGLSTTIHHPL